MGLTKMLATKRSPWRRAASIRLTCPGCRFPMVGTKATRSPSLRQARTCSRTAAIVVTVSKAIPCALEAVLGSRIFARLDRAHVALERVEVIARPVHEIPHEAGLTTGSDVQHVVGDEDLPVGVGTCADADDRHVELRGDRLAEACGDALEQHHVGAGGFEPPRFIDETRRGL